MLLNMSIIQNNMHAQDTFRRNMFVNDLTFLKCVYSSYTRVI